MFAYCSNNENIEIEDFENLFKKNGNFPETFDEAIQYKYGIIFIYDSNKDTFSNFFSKIKKDKELIKILNDNFKILIATTNEKDKFCKYLEYELLIDERIFFIHSEKKNKFIRTPCKMDFNVFKEEVNKFLTKIENEKKNMNSNIDNNKDDLENNYYQNSQLNNYSYENNVINFNNNINSKNSNFIYSNQSFNSNNYNSFQNISLIQSNNEQNMNKISNKNKNTINSNNKSSFLNNFNIPNNQNNNLLVNNSSNISSKKIKENYQTNSKVNGSYNSELYYKELIKNNNINNLNKNNSNYFNNNINNEFSENNNILNQNSIQSINESYNENNNNTTKIVFRFPSLKRVNKTFNKYDKIELMFDFINSLGDEIFKELKQKSFIFSQPFPNKFFTLKDKEQTFYEAELWPEGILDIIPDKKK